MNDLIWKEKRSILITCPKGIPPYLKAELEEIGFPVVAEYEAAIETSGTLEDSMELNLRIRTGHRILFLLKEFRAEAPEALYKNMLRMPWEEWIATNGYLSVTSTADTASIRDSRFVNVKAKDAIVDRIRDKTGVRPDSGPDRRGVVVHVYWRGDRVWIYFDTSGEPLSRRGYRKIPLQAPMQETLAAGVVLATDWKGEGPFVNPMCGSGTLAIEAVLIALNRAPGILRDNFGFMHLKGFDPAAWKKCRLRIRGMEKKDISFPVIATDIRTEAVQASMQNAKTAGVDQFISFRRCPFEMTPVPDGKGVVILNPGYGERMGKEQELIAVYRGIGDYFKNHCQGYQGFIFTGNFDLAKKIGLRTSRRIPFYNSELECRLLAYEMYAGSRKNPGKHDGEQYES